jgi:hypothetical protein
MRPFIRFSDVRLAGEALLMEQANGGNGKLIVGVKRGAQGLGGLARRCCFGALAALLPGACATFDVTPFQREQITGDTWRACLAREYQVQSRSQVRNGRNWTEATRLASKGRDSLSSGQPQFDPIPSALSPQAQALEKAVSARGRTCPCATAAARLDAWAIALAQEPKRDQAVFAAAFNSALSTCSNPD